MVDYAKIEQEFIDEMEAGKFNIEVMPNNDVDYALLEDSDYEAFKAHLKSDSAKALCRKALNK